MPVGGHRGPAICPIGHAGPLPRLLGAFRGHYGQDTWGSVRRIRDRDRTHMPEQWGQGP
jgi:hypothetical protein